MPKRKNLIGNIYGELKVIEIHYTYNKEEIIQTINNIMRPATITA